MVELGAAIVGFVPGGDIAKGIAKSATKATAKGSAKIGTDLVQEVAKVAKASTAKVVDALRECNRERPKRGKERREGRRRLTRERAPTSIRTRAARYTMARDRKRVPTIRVSAIFKDTRNADPHIANGVDSGQEREGSVQRRSEKAGAARWARNAARNYNEIQSPGKKMRDQDGD